MVDATLTSETEVAALKAKNLELQRDIVRWANAHRILLADNERLTAELASFRAIAKLALAEGKTGEQK